MSNRSNVLPTAVNVTRGGSPGVFLLALIMMAVVARKESAAAQQRAAGANARRCAGLAF